MKWNYCPVDELFIIGCNALVKMTTLRAASDNIFIKITFTFRRLWNVSQLILTLTLSLTWKFSGISVRFQRAIQRMALSAWRVRPLVYSHRGDSGRKLDGQNVRTFIDIQIKMQYISWNVHMVSLCSVLLWSSYRFVVHSWYFVPILQGHDVSCASGVILWDVGNIYWYKTSIKK